MKKFLSLVLALVMTMSLVTISAGATDFTDDSKVQHEAAVKVMDMLGVVGGYSDGTFRPTANLTRGAAAKIITNIKLTPAVADALKGSETPFKDVPATNVFSGAIAYCASEGIITGYADGTFRPAGTLTGNAFMKMLIGVLGYDTTDYTGKNFATKVALTVKKLGLADGTTFVGAKAATREEACLYAFNALFLNTAYYTGGSKVTINGAEIVVGATLHEDGAPLADAFGLTKSDSKDALERPATKYTAGKKNVTIAKTPVLSYKGKVTGKMIADDLGMAKNDAAVTLKRVGAETSVKVSKTVNYTTEARFSTNYNSATYIYESKTTGLDYDVYRVDYQLGTVGNVTPAKGDAARYVTIAGKDYVTDLFARNDQVLYTLVDGAIVDAVAAETVEGTVTRKVGTTVTVDGKNYSYDRGIAKLADLGVKSKGVFTLSYDGSTIIDMNATKGVSSDLYAYVYAVDSKTITGSYVNGVYVKDKIVYTAYFVKADGTTASATVADQIDLGVWNYVINAKGEFETIGSAVTATQVVLNGKLNKYGDNYPTSSTKYVFVDATTTEGKITALSTKVVDGYKNAKSDATSAFVIPGANNTVDLVFVADKLVGTETTGLTAIITDNRIVSELVGDDIVYTIKAFNGKEITLPVKSANAQVPTNGAYVEYKLDADGYFEQIGEVKTAAVSEKTVNAVIDENLVVANAANIFTLNANTAVYVKDANGYSAGTLNDVVAEATVTVYENAKHEAVLVIVHK